MANDGETHRVMKFIPPVVCFATGNPHKAREMAAFAEATRDETGIPLCEIVLPTHMPAVTEDSGTFAGNARKKAVALKATLPAETWVLADDSGLCVDALNGLPGVESAYFAGAQGDSAANLGKLIEVMSTVPEGKRGAHFRCVLVLLRGAGDGELIFEGCCAGVLRREPAGGHGFGYDPLFEPKGFGATYAELGDQEKNKISHRAQAFAELVRWLTENKKRRSV